MSKRKKGNYVRPDDGDPPAEAVLITAIEDDDPMVPAATVMRFFRSADEAISRCRMLERPLPRLIDVNTPHRLLKHLTAAPILLDLDIGFVLIENIATLSSAEANGMAKHMSAHWELVTSAQAMRNKS